MTHKKKGRMDRLVQVPGHAYLNPPCHVLNIV